MFRLVALVCCLNAMISVAFAEPLVLYKPTTGEFWLTGTQQPFSSSGAASLALRSDSRRLVEATSEYGVVYPLNLSDDAWHHDELYVMVRTDYVRPYYVGLFASPGTPADDLSATYIYSSFGPRIYISEAIQIKVIPEPTTAWLTGTGIFAAICAVRTKGNGSSG